MKKVQNKGMSRGKMATLGATVAAVAATGYYFWGPKGKEHQQSAKKWTTDAKKKIVQKLKQGKNISESMYQNIVDDVVKPYAAKGAATAKEVGAFASTLKKDWKHIVAAAKKKN